MKKRIGIHTNLVHCKISEMVDTDTEDRYFVAKIYGWSNFKLYRNDNTAREDFFNNVIAKVKELRAEIEDNNIDCLPIVYCV